MRYQRRKRKPIGVPVISMGDIAFLLTIFFLVCSNFAKESGIRLQQPVSPDIDTVTETNISVLIDDQGRLYFQGREIPVDALQDSIQALIGGESDPEARKIMFKCDLDVDRSVFEPAIAAIVSAGGTVVAVGEQGDPRRNP